MKKGRGRHNLLVDGQVTIVTSGDTIECDEWQLGAGKDKFDCLDPPEPEPEPTVGLKAKHKGGGRWIVVNEASGKEINDGYLTKEEAIEMAASPGPLTEDEEPEPVDAWAPDATE